MVADSLRYWSEQMHIDGFRFDLGTILAREVYGFDEQSGFLKAVDQDPLLTEVKLIAEPWDCGPGGYQVGGFPPGWAEWNDKFRDVVRDFWRAEADGAELAPRLSASGDMFDHGGRRAWASVNFVTAHDGFTLNDWASYNDKHNEANGEDNKDGSSSNRSWNCGAEGPTDDKAIIELRNRQKRNMLATLLFSQGTPMLLGGDEFGRTQRGNNNAYCQDSDISWFNWQLGDDGNALLAFTKRLIKLRRSYPTLRRSRFLTGQLDERVAGTLRLDMVARKLFGILTSIQKNPEKSSIAANGYFERIKDITGAEYEKIMGGIEPFKDELVLEAEITYGEGRDIRQELDELMINFEEDILKDRLAVAMADLLILDGLQESFYGYHMGITAESIAEKYGISRQEQDKLGVLSHQRARKAIAVS